ncbi:unnamed protein product [Calypogeia fissa]
MKPTPENQRLRRRNPLAFHRNTNREVPPDLVFVALRSSQQHTLFKLNFEGEKNQQRQLCMIPVCVYK